MSRKSPSPNLNGRCLLRRFTVSCQMLIWDLKDDLKAVYKAGNASDVHISLEVGSVIQSQR